MTISYQIFARKYRPQSFDEVLGQEVAVQTLKNAIALGRIHQAYLFSGARGVGKTSLARIFAKSLNCAKGPTVAPCQTCAGCSGITQGRSLDVLEIDGASNTGVDDVRELREQVKYLPTNGKYKIYIIDEVHMLSQSAFNALLKTLEEPPPHVLFIFATTEPHKIPVTILSRCQQFEFRRLNESQLLAHLKNILKLEGLKKLPEESLELIAASADGSVRDSLSLLDQIISYCGEEAPLNSVREILGLADRALLFQMAEGVLKGDVKKILEEAENLYAKGGDLKIFSVGLLEIFYKLLLFIEGGEQFVSASPSDKDFLSQCLPLTDRSHLLVLFQILSRSVEEIARSDFARMVFNVALVKLAHARDLISIPEILDQLKKMESGKGLPPSVTLKKEAFSPPRSEVSDSTKLWQNFVKKVVEIRPQVGSILEHASPLKLENDSILLGFEPKSLYADMLRERMGLLQEVANDFFKKRVQFVIQQMEGGGPSLGQGVLTALQMREKEERERFNEIKTKALAHPLVQKAQEVLGAIVKEVKEIK